MGPGAAALRIQDGAIVVRGPAKPAGLFSPPGLFWQPLKGCRVSGHEHTIGWYADTILENDLITDDSVLLVSTERADTGAPLSYTFSVSIVSTDDHFAQLRISALGIDLPSTCDEPPVTESPIVHYLVINPEP
jgi:hypothetical protein